MPLTGTLVGSSDTIDLTLESMNPGKEKFGGQTPSNCKLRLLPGEYKRDSALSQITLALSDSFFRAL